MLASWAAAPVPPYEQQEEEGGKKTQILDLLRRTKRDDKIIVFANMKKTTDVLARALENAHYYVGVLHGGKTQDQREDTLEAFFRAQGLTKKGGVEKEQARKASKKRKAIALKEEAP